MISPLNCDFEETGGSFLKLIPDTPCASQRYIKIE
jgi:hypothetical protein